jgi:uncharacterized cofD-like protein
VSATEGGAGVGVLRAVVIGGGHGGARTLEALRVLRSRGVAVDITAVVSTADDGGSSGRLRRDHDVVAFGDLRMALAAAATRTPLDRLVRHRFARGELSGHSFGNLLLLALVEQHEGDLLAALTEISALLGTDARILPATCDQVTLHARTDVGEVSGQTVVARTRRIARVWLEPDAPSAPQAVLDAVRDAHVIVVGPGSLYTSILPNLLVPALADALRACVAHVLLVGNLREQSGETEGMDLADHVVALSEHVVGLRVDSLVAHVPDAARAVPAPMAGVAPLALDVTRLAPHVGRLVTADLAGESEGHDVERYADALAQVLQELARPAAVHAR